MFILNAVINNRNDYWLVHTLEDVFITGKSNFLLVLCEMSNEGHAMPLYFFFGRRTYHQENLPVCSINCCATLNS